MAAALSDSSMYQYRMCGRQMVLKYGTSCLGSMKSLHIQCASHICRSAHNYNILVMYHSFLSLEPFLQISLDLKLGQKANSARSTDIVHLQGNDLSIHFATFYTKKLGHILDICSKYLTFFAIIR